MRQSNAVAGMGGMRVGGWYTALLLLELAGLCSGHFRYASMYWERDVTDSGYMVTFTIRSSWWRSYPAFKVYFRTNPPARPSQSLQRACCGACRSPHPAGRVVFACHPSLDSPHIPFRTACKGLSLVKSLGQSVASRITCQTASILSPYLQTHLQTHGQYFSKLFSTSVLSSASPSWKMQKKPFLMYPSPSCRSLPVPRFQLQNQRTGDYLGHFSAFCRSSDPPFAPNV